MNQESKLLITLLRVAITGTPEPLNLEVDWSGFMRLAKMHKVEGLAYDGLRRCGDALQGVPASVAGELRTCYMHAIFQSTQQDALRSRLEEGLRQRQVPHIFLKGAVLKQNYPVPALRTMCDMDILVYTKDYPAIDALALELEGKSWDGDGNHHNFTFPGGLNIEFHPNLLHHDTPVGTQINPGWQYSKPADGYTMELTEEGFYLNTICHLANHFVDGGVGVRFVLDVWVNRYLRKPQADRTFVERELEAFGLLDFARNIEALADSWFGSAEEAPALEELAEYILTSGSHGTGDRAVLNAVSLSADGSGRSAVLAKVFYSREEMEDRFPWVKGKPWLLPAAWCARAYRAVTKRSGLIRDWVKGAGAVSQEEAVRQKERLARFGIRRQK